MLHELQTIILIGLFTQQQTLSQGIDSAADEKWRLKRSIKGTNARQTFSPSKSDDCILSQIYLIGLRVLLWKLC